MLVDGARVSLLVGFAAAFVSILIGGVVGVLAGFFGGKTDMAHAPDRLLPRDPGRAAHDRRRRALRPQPAEHHPDHRHHLLDDDSTAPPGTGEEHPRTDLRPPRTRDGRGELRLIFRHILPQVAPLVVANTVLLVATAIFAETFITFLGLGDPSAISWGRLIENAFTDDAILNNAWWAIVPPGVCVAIVVLAATMTGAAIEEALNPRLAVGHLSVRRFRMRALPSIGRVEPSATLPPPTGAAGATSGKGAKR